MPFTPDEWIEQLRQCQHLSENDMTILCDRVKSILLEESNIQPVSSPVTICGDIHGQFWDLIELLRKGGEVPETSYIFMARRFLVCVELVRGVLTRFGCASWAAVVVSTCVWIGWVGWDCRAILWIEGTTV
ncbi:protein phosphatase [Coprinopsis cinerea AmutBmut pab1-1]|nr:protein phosphatase [Coprinopsis cinerea AmutBmut pab1-1]